MLLKTLTLSCFMIITCIVSQLSVVCSYRAPEALVRTFDRVVIRNHRGAPGYYDVRDKRGAKFDWQKDEESEEEMDSEVTRKRRKEMVYDDNIPVYSPNGTITYEMMLFGERRGKRKNDKKDVPERKKVTNDTVPTKSRYTKNKSDIKAILWDMRDEEEVEEDLDAIVNANDHETKSETTTASEAPHLSNITTSRSETADDDETKPTNTEITNTTQSPIPIPTTPQRESAVAMQTSKPSTEKSMKMDTLSVNEDMIRVYTIDKAETYGHGRAKPRLISQELAKMKFEEYKTSEETAGEEATRTTTTSNNVVKHKPNNKN